MNVKIPASVIDLAAVNEALIVSDTAIADALILNAPAPGDGLVRVADLKNVADLDSVTGLDSANEETHMYQPMRVDDSWKTTDTILRTVAAVVVVLLAMLTLRVDAAESSPGNAPSAYRLGAGDEISIRVYGETEMDVKTRLGDQGVINYPFLGELKVAGLTVGELEQLITRGLKGSYLVDPAVTVDIAEYRPFFVNGDVSKPGAIPYQPGVTLRKAIAMAGGFTERANRSGADIISGAEPGQKPRRVTMDEFIQPGDIVTVKPSFF